MNAEVTKLPISEAMQSIVVQAPIKENNHIVKTEPGVGPSRSSHFDPVLIGPARLIRKVRSAHIDYPSPS